jgi:hypothetical protein
MVTFREASCENSLWFPVSPIRATWPAYRSLLDFIVLTVLRDLFCNIPNCSFISSLLVFNILLSICFQTLVISVVPSKKQLFTTIQNSLIKSVLYMLILNVLETKQEDKWVLNRKIFNIYWICSFPNLITILTLDQKVQWQVLVTMISFVLHKYGALLD